MEAIKIKLIEAIKNNSTKKEGTISISKFDGVAYRYDRYCFNYESAFSWMVKLFDKIAGTKSTIQIDNFSISYDRPKYKGSNNGKFYMSELIELNIN